MKQKKLDLKDVKRIINECSNEKAEGKLVPVLGNKNALVDGKWLEEKLEELSQ